MTAFSKKVLGTLALICVIILTSSYLFVTSPLHQLQFKVNRRLCRSTAGNDTTLCENRRFRACAIGTAPLDFGGEQKAFLLETSGRHELNARQACSLESLARQNPHLKIYVLIAVDPKREKNDNGFLEAILKTYSNVKQEIVDLNAYIANTPLETWYYCSNWTVGRHRIAHLSDALRVLTVWKYGGYYFDFDFIHIKPITSYKNFIALEDAQQVGNSVFHSDRGNKLFADVLEEFSQTYRADRWAYNGPECFTRVLKRYCNTTDLLKMNFITCHGFNILPYSSFYPLYHPHSYELFVTEPRYNASQAAWINEIALGVHVWNKITADWSVKKNTPQLYVQLAKMHCPLTLALAPDVF